MRLKEIKPGMVIHCKDESELTELLKEAERLGYVWYPNRKPTNRPVDCGSTIHFYNSGGIKNIAWSDKTEGVTKFSDLILPELTAEEVLSTISEMCRNKSCKECYLGTFCDRTNSACSIQLMEPSVVIDACIKWKSDHEKKEPEVEWVYRVFGAENFGEKFFNTEEEAIARCEELVKSQKNRQYARYERVCRVKE